MDDLEAEHLDRLKRLGHTYTLNLIMKLKQKVEQLETRFNAMRQSKLYLQKKVEQLKIKYENSQLSLIQANEVIEKLEADLLLLWQLDTYSDDPNEYRELLEKYAPEEKDDE